MTHFGTIFGFIDDLTALSKFERSFHEVYPPELESKKEQHGYLEGSFLDLLISMENVLQYCLKRRTGQFPFFLCTCLT